MMHEPYCRFSHTLVDFRACVEAIENGAELSESETVAAQCLATLAAKLARLMAPQITTCSHDGSVRVIDPDSRTITEYQPQRTTYQVVDQDSAIRIKPANGGPLYLYVRSADSAHMKIIGAIRQLIAERDAARAEIARRDAR